MGARYAKPNVSPWMNTDSKLTDIPYRPSKALGIARCTTLLMIAYERASGARGAGPSVASAGCRGGGNEMRRWRERCFAIDFDRR